VPQGLCVAYAVLLWATREAELALLFAGQMASEALNVALKHWIREERPNRTFFCLFCLFSFFSFLLFFSSHFPCSSPLFTPFHRSIFFFFFKFLSQGYSVMGFFAPFFFVYYVLFISFFFWEKEGRKD
jgi:hypothetical protein